MLVWISAAFVKIEWERAKSQKEITKHILLTGVPVFCVQILLRLPSPASSPSSEPSAQVHCQVLLFAASRPEAKPVEYTSVCRWST